MKKRAATNRRFLLLLRFLWLMAAGTALIPGLLPAADEPPFGLDHRIPWTTSRIVGSPEPPLPYLVEKTFTNLSWRAPIFVTPEPDTESLLVVLQGGVKERPSRVLRVLDDPNTGQAETFLELSNRLIYRVALGRARRRRPRLRSRWDALRLDRRWHKRFGWLGDGTGFKRSARRCFAHRCRSRRWLAGLLRAARQSVRRADQCASGNLGVWLAQPVAHGDR